MQTWIAIGGGKEASHCPLAAYSSDSCESIKTFLKPFDICSVTVSGIQSQRERGLQPGKFRQKDFHGLLGAGSEPQAGLLLCAMRSPGVTVPALEGHAAVVMSSRPDLLLNSSGVRVSGRATYSPHSLINKERAAQNPRVRKYNYLCVITCELHIPNNIGQ